jgi:drug/metabolite transporter (DMT)-like permease
MNRTQLIGIALVLVSACGFGSGALFAKQGIYPYGVDWMTLLAWRFVFAAALSWGWLLIWPGQRRALRSMSRRRVLALVALGVLYMSNTGTYYAGLEKVDASLAALIVYLYPPLVAVLAIRFGRPLVGRRAWVALALATAGIALALGGINPQHAPPLLGLVIIFGSPLTYAVWVVLVARMSGERRTTDQDAIAPPYDSGTSASARSDSAPTAAILLTTTAIGWMSAALLFGRQVLPAQVPADAWWALLGIGLVATALAMQAFYAGARRIGAAQASLVSTVEPIYTISLAAILLHESLTAVQLVGGTMVIVGVIVAQTGQRRRAA